MICECSDKGCAAHTGASNCEQVATTTLYRGDMDDHTGTRFCSACADDAMESCLFDPSADSSIGDDEDDPATDALLNHEAMSGEGRL
jgi:hypothetical protein